MSRNFIECLNRSPVGLALAATLLFSGCATSMGFKAVFNGGDFTGWAGPVENYEVICEMDSASASGFNPAKQTGAMPMASRTAATTAFHRILGQ